MKRSTAQRKTFVTSHVYAQPPNVRDTVARINAGLPVKEFDTLRALLGLTVADLAGKVGISLATLSRRRRRHAALDPGHSDRILRFARLYRLAVDLYDGNEAAARTWLTRPARALEGQTPLDFAETEAGAHEVEMLIGRMEHGVYT
jgi:putative toxin-antitoxin system antitoxin component (TIGR02293 family)